MSAALIEAPGDRRERTRESRPSRGSARSVRPVARPATVVAPPQIGRPAVRSISAARACRSEPRATARPVSRAVEAGWQLTNRGIAVVLITGAVLVAAAVTVITATALTVTSEDYRPSLSTVGAIR
jgi:hypothetical protein